MGLLKIMFRTASRTLKLEITNAFLLLLPKCRVWRKQNQNNSFTKLSENSTRKLQLHTALGPFVSIEFTTALKGATENTKTKLHTIATGKSGKKWVFFCHLLDGFELLHLY